MKQIPSSSDVDSLLDKYTFSKNRNNEKELEKLRTYLKSLNGANNGLTTLASQRAAKIEELLRAFPPPEKISWFKSVNPANVTAAMMYQFIHNELESVGKKQKAWKQKGNLFDHTDGITTVNILIDQCGNNRIFYCLSLNKRKGLQYAQFSCQVYMGDELSEEAPQEDFCCPVFTFKHSCKPGYVAVLYDGKQIIEPISRELLIRIEGCITRKNQILDACQLDTI